MTTQWGPRKKAEEGARLEDRRYPGHSDSCLPSTCASPSSLPGASVGHFAAKTRTKVCLSKENGPLHGKPHVRHRDFLLFSFAEGSRILLKMPPKFLSLRGFRTKSQLGNSNSQGAATAPALSRCQVAPPLSGIRNDCVLGFPSASLDTGLLVISGIITTCWLPCPCPCALTLTLWTSVFVTRNNRELPPALQVSHRERLCSVRRAVSKAQWTCLCWAPFQI